MGNTDDDFRLGMRRLAAGVSLVTTHDGTRRYGMSATAVTSVTADPPTLLVCINRDSTILAPLLAAGRFGVNVLSEEHGELPLVFANPRLRAERFDHGDWHAVEEVPILRGAEVAFACRVSEHTSVGSHAVVFGEVVAVPELHADPRPLIWHEGAGRILARGGSEG